MDDSVEVKAGDIVHLMDMEGQMVKNIDGDLMTYQVTAVYRDYRRVGLVTYYGDYVGTFPMDYVFYKSEGPIFKWEDYEVGSTVMWLEHEDVYEGVIESLGWSTAKIKDVKKLMPVNHTVRVPYWKIPEGRKSKIATMNEPTSNNKEEIIHVNESKHSIEEP